MPHSGAILCRHFALRTRDYGPPGAPCKTHSALAATRRQRAANKPPEGLTDTHGASRHDVEYRARPAGPALSACSARQSSLRTQGRGPRRCQPTMWDAADAHRAAVPLERWRGTAGTVEARSRTTELASRMARLRRHPSALRRPPTRGVAPPAARGRVFSDAVHYVLPSRA